MALLHRDHDHDRNVDVPDHPPDDWTAPAPTATTATTASPVVVRRNSAGQTVRTVIATICVAAIAAFMALNADDVEMDLGFDTATAPLWAAIGIAAAVGVVLGWALGHRRCERQHLDG